MSSVPTVKVVGLLTVKTHPVFLLATPSYMKSNYLVFLYFGLYIVDVLR